MNTIITLINKYEAGNYGENALRTALRDQSANALREACRIKFGDHPDGTTWVASARKEAMVDALVSGLNHGNITPAPGVQPVGSDPAELLFAGLRGLMGQQPASIDRDAVVAIVQEQLASLPSRTVEVVIPDRPTVDVGRQHPNFDTLVKALALGTVALVGPAGSGKTSAARAAAKAYGQAFTAISVGAQTSASDIFGFVDANGQHRKDTVARAITEGHVLLLDEYDTCHPGVSKQMNGILDSDTSVVEFPHGKVEKHPDFRVVVAMNTTGRGASREYVGGRQQDASTLDRMFWIDWSYDLDFERELTLAQGASAEDATDWIETIEKLRDRAAETGLRVTIGTRAKIRGARALAAGFSKGEALDLVLLSALGADERASLKAAL